MRLIGLIIAILLLNSCNVSKNEQKQKVINEPINDRYDLNMEANARLLIKMPPENAVAILNKIDDKDVIFILKKTEEIAKTEGSMSIVPYWLSLMEVERAKELQRIMAWKEPMNEEQFEELFRDWNIRYYRNEIIHDFSGEMLEKN